MGHFWKFSPSHTSSCCVWFVLFMAACDSAEFVGGEPLNPSVVKGWSEKVQEYVLTLAREGLKTQELQKLFDGANYTVENKDGYKTVDALKNKLGNYFTKKQKAAWILADEVARLHDEFYTNATMQKMAQVKRLIELDTKYYSDSDLVETLPKDMQYKMLFKNRVSTSQSSVKISDTVQRDDPALIESVFWSAGLDKVFKDNLKKDPELRSQNFGSVNGFVRVFPSQEWSINFAGFHIDFDPRMRPWYISATSGPKDIVIILDCSRSMEGKKFHLAREAAKTVLKTLTKHDFVNVICAHESHWDEVGKWFVYNTEVLSCQNNRLVPASTSHRKDLIDKIDNLKAGGTSEFEKAFKIAFDLLQGRARTGCQSIIIFATDGQDNDGEPVRCGPGYYTRSGYVPGQMCTYDWSNVWSKVQARNRYSNPRTRIFSYLTMDDNEEFPGKLACDNQGYMKKLTDSEQIISQMQDYYSFLAANTISVRNVTWTSPYLDAVGLGLMVTGAIPVISKLTNKTIGVVGIDATLEEIESILLNDQWGSVYAFLINSEGETIFHPRLRPSSELVDDPIFIQISDLEQHDGKPADFEKVQRAMMNGKNGAFRLQDAIRSIAKGDLQDGVVLTTMPSTYYYASINDSVYSFAFNLADSDKEYRRAASPAHRGAASPAHRGAGAINFFSNLLAYNTSEVVQKLGNLTQDMNVQLVTDLYGRIPVSLEHTTVMLAPKTYCDPNSYLFYDNTSDIVIKAHEFLNSDGGDEGCPHGRFQSSVRSDVLITSVMEEAWKNRSHELLNDLRWTYAGTRSGVFRSFPGHRSRKTYDPTRRPWYLRALVNPDKTAVSNAYMDAFGIGKVITVSEAVFQAPPRNTSGLDCPADALARGGCPCTLNTQCISGKCRVYPGNRSVCAGDRVEAIAAADVLYRDFHTRVFERMKTAGVGKSCGANYTCPDGDHVCQTRCYLVDNLANLVVDPDFLNAKTTDEREYERVSLGRKEGDVMKQLIERHGFFRQGLTIDFQGICSISPYAPKVTLKGLLKTPEQEDDYYRNRGPIPPFRNEFGCIQDVVGYTSNDAVLGPDGMLNGTVDGPCTSGNYFLAALPKTNLYLLVIENWSRYRQSYFYNFNCHISNRVYDAGAFRIVNGTCAHLAPEASSNAREKCPALKHVDIKCSYDNAGARPALPLTNWLALFALYLLAVKCC